MSISPALRHNLSILGIADWTKHDKSNMDQDELHLMKMPTKRLVQEIKLLEKELVLAKKTLKNRGKKEETRWICGVCKEVMAKDVDEIVKHIQQIHKYPQTNAIMNTEEIYL